MRSLTWPGLFGMDWRTDKKKYHSDVDELSWQAGKSIPDFMTSRGKKGGNIYGFGNPCHGQIQKQIFSSRQIFCSCEENFEKFSRCQLLPNTYFDKYDGKISRCRVDIHHTRVITLYQIHQNPWWGPSPNQKRSDVIQDYTVLQILKFRIFHV